MVYTNIDKVQLIQVNLKNVLKTLTFASSENEPTIFLEKRSSRSLSRREEGRSRDLLLRDEERDEEKDDDVDDRCRLRPW